MENGGMSIAFSSIFHVHFDPFLGIFDATGTGENAQLKVSVRLRCWEQALEHELSVFVEQLGNASADIEVAVHEEARGMHITDNFVRLWIFELAAMSNQITLLKYRVFRRSFAVDAL